MPTPNDSISTTVADVEQAESSSSTFTGCPTEIDLHAEERSPAETQIDRTVSRSTMQDADNAEDKSGSEGQSTPPVPIPARSRVATRSSAENTERRHLNNFLHPYDECGLDWANTEDTKEEPIENAGSKSSSPATRLLDVMSDSDATLAQSMSSTTISPSSPPPQYLHFWESGRGRCEKVTTSFLRPGSKFTGTQRSERQEYEVQVEIKDVDLEDSFVCGYLRIQGLTDDHPTLTTFFEGEIVGPKHQFRTAHPSWGSNEKIDMTHWAKFASWRRLAKVHKSPNFSPPHHLQKDEIFMRWKEYFLVPDHRVKTISGASFEGFYYICFNQRVGSVSGVYFHAKSEKWQELELKHVEDRGCIAAMEFR